MAPDLAVSPVSHTPFPPDRTPTHKSHSMSSPTGSPPGEPPQHRSPPEANPDIREDDDADSAVDSGSIASSTISLTDSIFDYRRLNGRTYQQSKAGNDYWAPNDDQQNEGLDIIHNVLLMVLDNKLFLAPIGDNVHRVLDLGTGTGIWAIDFGDQFPNAEVIGTDISPIQPTWVPPNVKFSIDDCLLEWTWPENYFNFVHIRAMYGSIPDYGALYKKAFRHIAPGGWLQSLEMDVKIESDHVNIPEDHIFNQWADLFYQGGEKTGRTFTISHGHKMKELMEEAGFVGIVEKKVKVPLHGWPKDQRLQHAGYLAQLALDQSLDGFGTFLLTQIMGWGRTEATVFIAKMRQESRKESNYPFYMT